MYIILKTCGTSIVCWLVLLSVVCRAELEHGHVNSLHVNVGYRILKSLFREHLNKLERTYNDHLMYIRVTAGMFPNRTTLSRNCVPRVHENLEGKLRKQVSIHHPLHYSGAT